VVLAIKENEEGRNEDDGNILSVYSSPIPSTNKGGMSLCVTNVDTETN